MTYPLMGMKETLTGAPLITRAIGTLLDDSKRASPLNFIGALIRSVAFSDA